MHSRCIIFRQMVNSIYLGEAFTMVDQLGFWPLFNKVIAPSKIYHRPRNPLLYDDVNPS